MELKEEIIKDWKSWENNIMTAVFMCCDSFQKDAQGFPWWSSGWDSLQAAQVQSLVRELRSHTPHGVAKNQSINK